VVCGAWILLGVEELRGFQNEGLPVLLRLHVRMEGDGLIVKAGLV